MEEEIVIPLELIHSEQLNETQYIFIFRTDDNSGYAITINMAMSEEKQDEDFSKQLFNFQEQVFKRHRARNLE